MPFSSLVETEEIFLMEQAAICSNERLRSGLEFSRSIHRDELEEERDDLELSLHTLLHFGRQITLGMVCVCVCVCVCLCGCGCACACVHVCICEGTASLWDTTAW